jgi:hypothetical protein
MTLFKPAVREQIKLRAAIDGPTGSGKTFTALQWARIIAGENGAIGAVDTESGGKGVLRYVAAPGQTVERMNWWDPPYECGHLPALPPYDPRDLAKMIDVAGDELGEDGVLLVDSLTHYWIGEGGTLDIVDDAVLRGANKFTAWQEGTPAQRFMLDRLTSARCHVIVTMRSKMEYTIEETTDSRGERRSTVKRLGMQPEQRPGIEYEFDLVASMDHSHRLFVTKSRLPGLADHVAQFGRSHEVAEELAAWLETGARTISNEQADALRLAMDSIVDETVRRTVKNEFVAEFGVPTEVVDYRADEAAKWVAGRISTVQPAPDGGWPQTVCPKCEAWPGDPCLGTTGKPLKRVHTERPTEQQQALANGLDGSETTT